MSDLSETITAVPISRSEVTAMHLFIIGNTNPPKLVYDWRLRLLDLRLNYETTVPMTDLEMAAVFDWLETFEVGRFPKDIASFWDRLGLILFPPAEDIHESTQRKD